MKIFKKALSLLIVLILVSLCSCTQTTVVTSEIELPIESEESSQETITSEEVSSEIDLSSQPPSTKNYHRHHDFVEVVATSAIYDKNFYVTEKWKKYIEEIEEKAIRRMINDVSAQPTIRIIDDEKQLYNEFESAILAGKFFADVVCLPKDTAFPSIAQNVYAKCLNDYTKYFDFTSSDWVDNLTNQSMLINSKHYYLAYDKDISRVAGKGILFNNDLFKTLDEKTPHDYIKNNEWTLESFKNLITKMTCKKNNTQYYGVYMNNSIPTNNKIGNLFYETIADTVKQTGIEYESFAKEKELWQKGCTAMKIVDSLESFAAFNNDSMYFALLPQECENEYNTDQMLVYFIPSNVEEYRMKNTCKFLAAWGSSMLFASADLQSEGEQLKPWLLNDQYSSELLSKTVELSLKN